MLLFLFWPLSGGHKLLMALEGSLGGWRGLKDMQGVEKMRGEEGYKTWEGKMGEREMGAKMNFYCSVFQVLSVGGCSVEILSSSIPGLAIAGGHCAWRSSAVPHTRSAHQPLPATEAAFHQLDSLSKSYLCMSATPMGSLRCFQAPRLTPCRNWRPHIGMPSFCNTSQN